MDKQLSIGFMNFFVLNFGILDFTFEIVLFAGSLIGSTPPLILYDSGNIYWWNLPPFPPSSFCYFCS